MNLKNDWENEMWNADENENNNNKDLPKSILEGFIKSRSITLFKGVDAKSAKEVIEALLFLDAEDSTRPIKIYLNSPGGEVNSGFGIYDVMRFIKSDVKVICTGLCASIATIILMGAKKENRLTLPNSRFLIHQPLIGGTVRGPASDIQITAKEIAKTRDKINMILAAETGQSLEKVAKDTDRDFWMNANEALEYGLVTRIITRADEVG